MTNRTLVKAYATDQYVSIRTISRKGKSRHRFVFLRSEFDALIEHNGFISNDLSSFAIVRRDLLPRDTDILRIKFSWLSLQDDALSGYHQEIILPYGSFMQFMADSKCAERDMEWRALSLVETNSPKFIFKSRQALHQVLENDILKRKLVRFLGKNFHWYNIDHLIFKDEHLPYSFFFEAYNALGMGCCGGLILHNQEDMANAYYSIHT